MLVGACWLSPGQVTTFDLTEPGDGPLPAQETYFVVRGRLRISSGTGELVAEANDAVFFPSGRPYTVEGIGDEETFLVYTVAPAPR